MDKIYFIFIYFLRKEKKEEGFGLYVCQPRKNLHTGISVNKPKLPVTKYDQTLILAHMYDTSRYTANTKKYSGMTGYKQRHEQKKLLFFGLCDRTALLRSAEIMESKQSVLHFYLSH